MGLTTVQRDCAACDTEIILRIKSHKTGDLTLQIYTLPSILFRELHDTRFIKTNDSE